jgi:MFS family permease
MRLNRRQNKVFYGWWIAGACACIQLYMGGVVAYGFTAVFQPIADEFGWSYTQISFAASLRGMEMGILAPIMGLLVDRFGPRRILFAGSISTGLGLILLSYATTLGTFYGAFVLVAIGMSTSSVTVIFTAVANWFRKRVATATGIAASGAALAGLLVPLVTVLVDNFGWRWAMLSLGLGMWVIPLPLSLLFRHKPEQYGYLPDGNAVNTLIDNSNFAAQRVKEDIRIKQVLTSRPFWHLTLAFTFLLSSNSSVITHVMPYLSSVGMARSTSSLVASAIPLASIFGRLGAGWFGDRFGNKRVTILCSISTALGLLSFNFVAMGRIGLLILFLMLFGMGMGSNITMRAALVREYFGSSRFGTVFGIMTGVVMLGMIAGPPMVGWIYDKQGSYQNTWFLFVIFAIVAIFILATIPVNRQDDPASLHHKNLKETT